MDAQTAKIIIEKSLRYDEVKRLLVKLVQHASPQTERLESEPAVLALISDVIKAELEQAGLHPAIDQKGNLVLRLKGREHRDRLMFVGYAMNAAPKSWTAHRTSWRANAFGAAALANKRAVWLPCYRR